MSEYFWKCDGDSVVYAKSTDELDSESGDYYSDDVYKQRFYRKHVFRGEDFTLIFCDPHVDGCKWFKVFYNSMEVNK